MNRLTVGEISWRVISDRDGERKRVGKVPAGASIFSFPLFVKIRLPSNSCFS